MATHDSHAATTPADTTGRQRRLTTATREACETILESVLRPTSLRVRDPVAPDGDWHRAEHRPLRETWTHQRSDDRVQLASAGPAATWQLEHQTTDGRCVIVERGLEREAAYRKAERYMADLDSVSEHNRTGRAAENSR